MFVTCRPGPGSTTTKLAPVKNTIYSLPVLAELLRAANRRYLDFRSALDDPSEGIASSFASLAPARDQTASYRGINFFEYRDLRLMIEPRDSTRGRVEIYS